MSQVFSFDIVSDFDKGEMNNVYDQVHREIITRYDLKGTAAGLDWLDPDKQGFIIVGDTQFHLEAIMDMIRRKSASRGIDQKTFDTSREPSISGMKHTWVIPFRSGLDHDKAKKINAALRESLPKLKTQVQGDEIRVASSKKDELQSAMQIIRSREFDSPVSFTNFR